MTKTPFLPLFFGDFLASTFTWSGEEQSLYLLLLGYQWVSGPLPNDVRKLARSVRYDERAFRKLWGTVQSKFDTTPEGLLNSRLEEHRERANALAEKNRASGRKGAESRWQKDGERHSAANGSGIADAIATPKPRHKKANGVTHGNPSHPIPEERERTRSRASPRPPEGYSPDLDYARREIPDIDAEAEARKFRDWEFSPPRRDWDAVWRTWIARAKESGRYVKTGAGGIQWQ